jgi:circadian clock protein KaiC
MNTKTTHNELHRFPTGIDGLDMILRGGFLRGGVYIIQGTPGAGKTILANEMCFRHVSGGGRVVYVTLLAESHGRMLQHLAPMSFFDESVIPESLYYVSGFRMLEDEGLKGLVSLLRREIKGQQASLLVLDGLVAAEEAAGSDREFKKFIHELQNHSVASDCTILLLTSGATRAVSAEHTMVDGLVELDDQLVDVRTERSLLVRKFRGSGFLRGRHPFRITQEGIKLFPRIETTCADHTHTRLMAGRLSTGILGLDAMLRGGLPEASVTGLVGATGTGKTTLGLHFLQQSSKDEPGLFFGFFETPEHLKEKAAALGRDIAGLVKAGHVEIVWQPQGENILDELGRRLLDAVRRRKVKRLVLDGLNGFLECAIDRSRISRYLACLTNELRALGATTVMTVEARDVISPMLQLPVNGVSALIENVIFMRFFERDAKVSRLLSITKVRASEYDSTLREFTISAQGIQVGDIFELRGNLTASLAHRSRPKPAKTARKKRKSR